MKKIAIATNYPFHLECVGFLLELLDNNDITVYYTADSYGYLIYFKKMYNFKKKNFQNFNENEYDIIIKLSANDNGVKIQNIEKTLGVLHLGEPEQKFDKINLKNFITLSPYVKTKSANILQYILPIYRGIQSNNLNNNIVYIGMFNYTLFNADLLTFIKNIKYNVLFIGGAPGQLRNLTNVKSLPKLNTEQMVELLNSSKFILCRNSSFFNDRFTGAISLALSHNIPLIMEKKMADDYNIPSFNYNKNYSELIDKINNLTEEAYNVHKQELLNYSNITIKKNRLVINEILNNI
jgi:hypothetical protein